MTELRGNLSNAFPARRALERRIRLGWGWLSVWLALPVAAARAQDALYNAVSLEGTIASESKEMTVQPDQPHLGPVQLALGASANVSGDDNINGSQNHPQSDVISQVQANLGLAWPATDHSDLKFGTGIGYLHYFNNPSNNGLVITPDSALSYALSWDDVVITPYDHFNYTRQITTEAALANVATLPQFENTAGAEVQWDPEHWTFLASYGHDIFLSDGANDYLNRSSEYFFGRAGWRFAAATEAGLEASESITAYQLRSEGNTDSFSIGAYAEWQVRPSLSLTLRGGPTFYEFHLPAANGGNSALNSYYVSFALRHQLTDFLSHNLEIDRDVQLGANQGSQYIEQLAVSYSMTWSLTRRISLGATLAYDQGRQPFGIFPAQSVENYQQYNGSLQFSWRFADHWTGNLGYSHILRDSNLSERGYSANSASLGLSYAF